MTTIDIGARWRTSAPPPKPQSEWYPARRPMNLAPPRWPAVRKALRRLGWTLLGIAAAPFVGVLLYFAWPLVAMALPVIATYVGAFFLLSLIPMS